MVQFLSPKLFFRICNFPVHDSLFNTCKYHLFRDVLSDFVHTGPKSDAMTCSPKKETYIMKMLGTRFEFWYQKRQNPIPGTFSKKAKANEYVRLDIFQIWVPELEI